MNAGQPVYTRPKKVAKQQFLVMNDGGDTCVSFKATTPADAIEEVTEHLWGDPTDIMEGDTASVYLRVAIFEAELPPPRKAVWRKTQ